MEDFIKPLQPHEIEWKIQSKTKTNKTRVVPYIDARAVYDRLDKCFGWKRWQIEIEPHTQGVTCRMSIQTDKDDYWATREDGSDYTKIEAFKGGISGAIKRTAHQFGLGRELYSYPTVLVDGDIKFISKTLLGQLNNITNAYLNGNHQDVYVIKEGEQVGEPF